MSRGISCFFYTLRLSTQIDARARCSMQGICDFKADNQKRDNVTNSKQWVMKVVERTDRCTNVLQRCIVLGNKLLVGLLDVL